MKKKLSNAVKNSVTYVRRDRYTVKVLRIFLNVIFKQQVLKKENE